MNLRRSISALVLGTLLLLTGSCSRKVALSDSELAQIFHDAYLANAYSTTSALRLDSLRLYEPIFQRYGYTTEDVQHTIGSFSTRKSARLSDVVERSISMLEARGKELDREVAILDTVNNITQRRARRVIFDAALMEYRSYSDSASMAIVLEGIKEGEYKLDFDYLIDSTDKTKAGYKTTRWLEKSKINEKSGDTTLTVYNKSSSQLRRNEIAHFNSSIKVDKNAERAVILVAHTDDSLAKRHNATIKRLKVTHYPTLEESLTELYDELLNVRVFDYELLNPTPKDSL